MTADTRLPHRPKQLWSRCRSWLGLLLLGIALTLAGMVPAVGWPPWKILFTQPVGLSEEDTRHLAEVKKLGGEAHFMERTPRFLGRFGGRDRLHYGFSGKSFNDDALARFIKQYGDCIWGLDLRNTGITDAGLIHLAGLRHVRQLSLGNQDLRGLPGIKPPQNNFTDAGLAHLSGLTDLMNLNLGGLPVTDAGLDAIKDLPKLGGLYLDRTRVNGSVLGRLKSLPELAV